MKRFWEKDKRVIFLTILLFYPTFKRNRILIKNLGSTSFSIHCLEAWRQMKKKPKKLQNSSREKAVMDSRPDGHDFMASSAEATVH